jgi:hypothetical protein
MRSGRQADVVLVTTPEGRRAQRSWLALLILTVAAATGCGGGGTEPATDTQGTTRQAALAVGKAEALDAPTLSFGTTTLTVTVQAGASGAPAGFSLQWMELGEYLARGWPESSDEPGVDSTFCKASFSGVPDGSSYGLGPFAAATIEFTPGIPQCGARVLNSCVSYVFRAFAHNDPVSRTKRSAFTSTSAATVDCPAGGGGGSGGGGGPAGGFKT